LLKIFGDCLKISEPVDADDRRLLNSLQRLKPSARPPAVSWASDAIAHGDSSIVTMLNLTAVKTPKNSNYAGLIRREAAILKSLKHPLVLALSSESHRAPGIATEYAGNGSLANALASAAFNRHSRSGANRIARVVAGIALGMRFVHSRDTVHRDLQPENILLDWNWNVRIADFGRSLSFNVPPLPASAVPRGALAIESHYRAPECYDGTFHRASDVFAFGMIVYEIAAGRSAFPVDLSHWQIAFRLLVMNERPEFPEFVRPAVRALIEDCWASDPDERPSFVEIVDRLAEMQFRVTENVDSRKLAQFMKTIEEWEAAQCDNE
jgi:serine/threonine protein kinase